MPSVQRRFNSTGRVRIPRRNVVIEFEAPLDEKAIPAFSGILDLSQMDLPGGAEVCLEAYYRSSSMRFACATFFASAAINALEAASFTRIVGVPIPGAATTVSVYTCVPRAVFTR